MVMGDEGGQMAIFEGTIPQSHPQVIPFNPADDFDREGRLVGATSARHPQAGSGGEAPGGVLQGLCEPLLNPCAPVGTRAHAWTLRETACRGKGACGHRACPAGPRRPCGDVCDGWKGPDGSGKAVEGPPAAPGAVGDVASGRSRTRRPVQTLRPAPQGDAVCRRPSPDGAYGTAGHRRPSTSNRCQKARFRRFPPKRRSNAPTTYEFVCGWAI